MRMSHVFISYVRENRALVDRLATTLLVAGIKVWLDRDAIAVGSRWADAIRVAIREGAFFIACFSAEYYERDRTYMNEELTIAIEELRQRSTDRVWFIPVLLSHCRVPDRAISSMETLASLQWVDLAEDWETGIERILSVVKKPVGRAETRSLFGFPKRLEELAAFSQTLFAQRVAHYSKEKHAIAEHFGVLLLQRCRHLIEHRKLRVVLWIDSGTTLYPFCHVIGEMIALAHTNGEQWVTNQSLSIVTNNIPGGDAAIKGVGAWL